MKNVFAKVVIHRSEKRIQLVCDFDDTLIEKIKSIQGRKWSKTMGCWHIPYNQLNANRFNINDNTTDNPVSEEKTNDLIIVKKESSTPNWLFSENSERIKKRQAQFIQKNIPLNEFKRYLKHKRYSENTIETYLNAVKSFFSFIQKRPEEVSTQDFMDYNYRCIIEQGQSRSMQNATISALKLFYRKFSSNQIDMEEFERPHKYRKLPVVLSQEEIKLMIENTGNLKHKTILSLMYSAGLRMSELLNLKINDIDSSRMVIHVIQGKGFKDRNVTLSSKILDLLRTYYKAYKPTVHLFEGVKGGPYSSESVGRIVKKAAKKAGINKRVTAHTLRHSYATHLLESGVDLRYIQVLLGHNSSRTTEIYTHVSNYSLSSIKSPIDKIMESRINYITTVYSTVYA